MRAASTTPIEIWKEIPGYEGRYEASSLGRIRSSPKPHRTFVKVLRPSPRRRTGHLYVNLTDASGRVRRIGVHQLVLWAFVGPRPSAMHQGQHRDDDPTNNSASNLKWGTPAENSKQMAERGRSMRGTRAFKNVLSENQALEIRRRVRAGEKQAVLAREFGVGQVTISDIKLGYSWAWLQEAA